MWAGWPDIEFSSSHDGRINLLKAEILYALTKEKNKHGAGNSKMPHLEENQVNASDNFIVSLTLFWRPVSQAAWIGEYTFPT